MQTTIIISVIFGVWLTFLSVLIFKVYKLFTKLSLGIEADLTKKGFGEINKRLSFLENDGKGHIQKVGLVRFNPFKELGGDQSFCLAILDGEDSGILLTGLHTRDRTRVYMKKIIKGKSDHDLSVEEKKALDNAYAKK